MKLDEDCLNDLQSAARGAGMSKRVFAQAMIFWLDEVPHGLKGEFFTECSKIWLEQTGEDVSTRTLHYWLDAVRLLYGNKEFAVLSDAQLLAAPEVAEAMNEKFGTEENTAQSVCALAVLRKIYTVPGMWALVSFDWKPPDQYYAHVPPGLKQLLRHLEMQGFSDTQWLAIRDWLESRPGFLWEKAAVEKAPVSETGRESV